ncbi:DUF6491 family protein [Luteibacter yeojuensis]|uniref:DUF6491 family protein n=1 Tax=Luteibacter yeojuensis TaxID=345309 RepID=UPI0006965FEC|nr:DUF6491 family protein [Luteibacter yeojuensis]
MNARHVAVACLLLVSTAPWAAGRPQQPVARQELQVNDCMRTDRISNYAVVDDRTVAVANGPNYFKITTNVDCPRMDLGGGVRFRASENVKAVAPMRICGSINEQIVRRDDPPCQIQAVEKIDKATYDQLNKNAKRKASGPGTSGGH